MNAPTPTLRVLPQGPQEEGEHIPTPVERQATAKVSTVAQKLPTGVHEWLTSFTTAWLQKHAGPAVREWLEERTNRPILVSISRAARLLDLSEPTIERMAASGHLPVVRVGSRTLIRRSDLEAWAEGLPVREVAR